MNPSIEIHVDPLNPGQFFACCGLLELADRLWPGTEAAFAQNDCRFHLFGTGTLPELIRSIATAELEHCDPTDVTSSPIAIGAPFRRLRIDWWEHPVLEARDLKVWAGTMESYGIAASLQAALRSEQFHGPNLLDVGMVVANSDDPSKKKEPYYYDARRAPNAHSRDTGFSANDLGLNSIAHPAVELLCLIGLQVARPERQSRTRMYDYRTWTVPIPTNLLLAASSGAVSGLGGNAYRFENWFRTGQKKHKAFRSAMRLA
ncbi:hypothetical protein [Tuwongella immobilis]|uniref:Uncharacterized protein n=1 Tax=Tuwongella immobilis TaxID=692036 RepID=A0A6C2YK77_9BACT|nr:hypothetical protein [Tuwongella immobilis]VIP01701.1 Uncharacterized protein OS=Planctomyces limnophilus (strain ATCC 43296 / DSM 3776 / IFAM 1008 / 290) GN=Plim_3148 PE=4 SV=1 [Tuwongella immobilis]VTR99191.1 Uncharacterized protein OS=Planctomyces limnophilus (strain ATCC 43296 / DSM 3776 / IFAM 1008 / 290) GN=Plim_3148 PE=4 SV=1 [Tuwongella immobilis]